MPEQQAAPPPCDNLAIQVPCVSISQIKDKKEKKEEAPSLLKCLGLKQVQITSIHISPEITPPLPHLAARKAGNASSCVFFLKTESGMLTLVNKSVTCLKLESPVDTGMWTFPAFPLVGIASLGCRRHNPQYSTPMTPAGSFSSWLF